MASPDTPDSDTAAARAVRAIPSWAIIGIFLILLFNFVIQAQYFLMPVTLGFLLFFVFVPLRRILMRFGLSAGAVASVITSGLLLMVAVIGFAISGPVSDAISKAPDISARVDERVREIRGSFASLENAAKSLDRIAVEEEGAAADQALPASSEGPASVPPPAPNGKAKPKGDEPEIKVKVDAEGKTPIQRVMSVGPTVLSQIIFTLVLLFFLISSGDLLYLKIVQSFDGLARKRAAYAALREIESSLGAYLGAITLINAALGVCIGIAMWAWDMPSPLLWGIAAFVLNFIPYFGAIAGVALSGLVSLIVHPDLTTPFFVAGTYLLLTSIEGQLVTPYFVSRRLQLNTVVVFITVALWAWLWSVLGMVVAVPLLVVIKVLSENIPGLEKFGNFLAGEAPEMPDESEDGDEVSQTT